MFEAGGHERLRGSSNIIGELGECPTSITVDEGFAIGKALDRAPNDFGDRRHVLLEVGDAEHLDRVAAQNLVHLLVSEVEGLLVGDLRGVRPR